MYEAGLGTLKLTGIATAKAVEFMATIKVRTMRAEKASLSRASGRKG